MFIGDDQFIYLLYIHFFMEKERFINKSQYRVYNDNQPYHISIAQWYKKISVI